MNFVFKPNKEQVYTSKKTKKIKLLKSQKILCAKYRKGHFEGVIEVMERLTKIIKPTKIFMGEKDFQQLLLVKRFIENNYNSKIVSCKTIRDKNMLALSSRNKLLNKNNLLKAGQISKNLISFKKRLSKKNISKKLILIKKEKLEKKYNINIEYLEIRKKNNLQLSNKLEKSKAFKNFMGDILITLIEEKVNDESTEANTQESDE